MIDYISILVILTVLPSPNELVYSLHFCQVLSNGSRIFYSDPDPWTQALFSPVFLMLLASLLLFQQLQSICVGIPFREAHLLETPGYFLDHYLNRSFCLRLEIIETLGYHCHVLWSEILVLSHFIWDLWLLIVKSLDFRVTFWRSSTYLLWKLGKIIWSLSASFLFYKTKINNSTCFQGPLSRWSEMTR